MLTARSIYIFIFKTYVVKLNNCLHLLDVSGLSNFLNHVAGISADLDKTSSLAISNLLLSKHVRDIETYRGGRWLRSVFWASGRLCMAGSGLETEGLVPDTVVVSAVIGSPGYERMISAGCEPRAHPYSYSTDWTKCFVFKNSEVVR